MKEAWDWIKTAPLPVVIAFNLMLGGYVVVFVEQVKDSKRDAAEAKVLANAAALLVDHKLERVDVKIDVLIASVATLQADLVAHRRDETSLFSHPRARTSAPASSATSSAAPDLEPKE